MASRQGGIHISAFVVALLVGLICFIVLLLVNADLNDALAERDVAKDQAKKKEEQVKRQSTEIGELRKLIGGDPDSIQPVAELTSMIEQSGQELAKSLGSKSELEYKSFIDLYTDSFELIKKLKGDLARQTTQSETNLENYQKMIEEKSQLTSAKDDVISGLRNDLNLAQAANETAKREAQEEIDRLRTQIDENADRFTAQISDLNTDVWLKENQILQLKDRIEVLKNEINKEKTFADVTPDGEILQVSEEEGLAWIDIGREARLRRGLKFDVFQYIKGGRKLKKGLVEVAQIDAQYAEVKILRTYDSLNPIAQGDKVACPFYNKDDVPTFVIAGEKLSTRTRASKGEVIERIKRFGGKVEDDVHVKTSYLVAIEGYQDTDQYKDARELGVTILRENELLEFIGF